MISIALIFSLLQACFSVNDRDKIKVKPTSITKYTPLTDAQREHYSQQLWPLYNELLGNHGFSGGIIVAKNGEVVFEDYKGYYNYGKKESLTANSALHIASVSKTFTAMVVLKLMEEGKINVDDNVKTYLPSFPYENITIKMLLNHRSGLPNYVHAMETTVTKTFVRKNKRGKKITYTRTYKTKPNATKLVTNAEVLEFLATKKPAVEALPNRKFNYCNTNYALLALVVEKVTNTDFPTYMKQRVFDSLGMKNTFVFSIKDVPNYIPSYKGNYSPYNLEFLDCVYGDKNVYSTPRDLLAWDDALYNNKFVKQETLQMAYTPYSFERPGTHNYGLGWRLFTYPDKTIPYHNGWWHGNNAVFTRLVTDTATIIVLGNKYNSRIYKAKNLGVVFAKNPSVTDSLVESEL